MALKCLATALGRTTMNARLTSLNYKFLTAHNTYSSNKKSLSTEQYKDVMKIVPQPVVIVTGAMQHPKGDSIIKRGVTCSSFTSISLKPPIVSFAMNNPSRMHDLLTQTKKFAIHVLTAEQVSLCLHFAKPAQDSICQFEDIKHTMDDGVPVISGTNAILYCGTHMVHTVGDHFVWYADVQDVTINTNIQQPLLFHSRKFFSIGDNVFIESFEETTLPFDDWTHEAHIRMAWYYITDLGMQQAKPLIKSGIKRFNERNKEKITHGYHETITEFYIHMLNHAINESVADTEKDSTVVADTGTKLMRKHSFDDFIERHAYLKVTSLLYEYYSREIIHSDDSKKRFVLPDKKPLPGM